MVVMGNDVDNTLEVELLATTGTGLVSVNSALIFIGYALPHPDAASLSKPQVLQYFNVIICHINTIILQAPPKIKLHKSSNYDKNQEMEVFITHVIDPHNIYVQVVSFGEVISAA